jgi:hypothetical protein
MRPTQRAEGFGDTCGHRNPRKRTAVGVLLVGIAIGVGACGGSKAPASNPAKAKATASAPAEFGLSQAELAEHIERTERLIAACMTSSGFRYVALDANSIRTAMASDKSAPGLSSDDFVKQFGLGITTQPDKPIVAFGAGPQNAVHLKGLPASEQTAYRRALWGEHPDYTHVRALEDEDFATTGGCTRSAAEKVYSPDQLSGTYVNPGDARLVQDPRMIAATKKWSECMRAKNFDYTDPLQVETDLRSRLAAIVQGQNPKALTGPALTALKALQGEELAVAAVLTTCEAKHIEPVQATVESELYGSPAP